MPNLATRARESWVGHAKMEWHATHRSCGLLLEDDGLDALLRRSDEVVQVRQLQPHREPRHRVGGGPAVPSHRHQMLNWIANVRVDELGCDLAVALCKFLSG